MVGSAILALAQARRDILWIRRSPAAWPIFKRLLIERQLVSAMRCEGYSCCDRSMAIWRAGLGRLDDGAPPGLRAPGSIARFIYEAGDWREAEPGGRWCPPALMLKSSTDMNARPSAVEIGEALDCARQIASSQGGYVADLAECMRKITQITDELRSGPVFSGSDQGLVLLTVGDRVRVFEGTRVPAPWWVLDLCMGRLIADTPLPCPGIGHAVAARRDGALDYACSTFASAVEECAFEALQILRMMAAARLTRNAGSRLPDVLGLLAMYRGLRSSQIEAALGITRIGLRKVMADARSDYALKPETLSGVLIYWGNRLVDDRLFQPFPTLQPMDRAEAESFVDEEPFWDPFASDSYV